MKKQKEIKIKSPKEISDDALVRKISTWLAGWLIFAAIDALPICSSS